MNVKNKKTYNYSEDNEMIINNIDNYNNNIVNSFEEILTKIEKIIVDYTMLYIERIRINNRSEWNYIFQKGLETITNSFKLIYYYTKNINLTCYNCQKSYYVYIEYIEQINNSNVSYLKLTPTDAVICAYKQNIYKFNDKYREKMMPPDENDAHLLDRVDNIANTYKNMMSYIVHTTELSKLFNNDFIKEIMDEYKTIKNEITNETNIDMINAFVVVIIEKNVINREFINLISEFLKKIKQKKYKNHLSIIKNNIQICKKNDNINSSNIIEHIFDI